MNQDRMVERRTVLAGMALTLALPVLNSRAEDGPPPGPGGPPATAPATGPAPDAEGWLKTVPLAALKGKKFDAEFARFNKVMLSNDGKHIYAFSSKCTHKGCTVKPAGDILQCPCHGAQFDITGAVLPEMRAKRDLPRYALRLAADGTIEVNVRKSVEPTDPSASLSVESAS